MTDHPILYSDPMIRAILDDRKKMTRRVLKLTPSSCNGQVDLDEDENGNVTTWSDAVCRWVPLPFNVGDRLWVREQHFAWGYWETTDKLTKTGRTKRRFVRAWDVAVKFDKSNITLAPNRNDGTEGWHKRLGRFMFKADSRLTQIVTDVKVERVQDISEMDAAAEGVSECPTFSTPERPEYSVHGVTNIYPWQVAVFEELWDSINGKDPVKCWAANPWVVAVSTDTMHANIDQGVA